MRFGAADQKPKRRFIKWKDIKTNISNKASGIPNWFRVSFSELSNRASLKWSGSRAQVALSSFAHAGKKTMVYSLEILGSAAMAMEFAFIIYELVREVKTQDFYVYTAIDGTEWIWDGGLTVSKYFGIETRTISDIKNMILTNPVMITLPNIEESYYFNSTKYYDPKDMKIAAYKYIKNGGILPRSGAFKVSYTLFNEGTNASIMKADSISDLINLAINDMGLVANDDGSFNISNLNENSEFISTISTSLSNGVIVSPNDNNVTLGNNISTKMRATKFTILPDLESGVANGKLTTEFIYPGNYWENGKIITPDQSTYKGKILVDNSANQLKDGIQINSYSYLKDSYFMVEDAKLAENQSKNALYENFKSSFNLAYKQTLPNGLLKHNYSDISSTISSISIYRITINGEESIFIDEQKAMAYLSKKLNLKTLNSNDVYYIYEDKVFRNDQEIMEWIKFKNSHE